MRIVLVTPANVHADHVLWNIFEYLVQPVRVHLDMRTEFAITDSLVLDKALDREHK